MKKITKTIYQSINTFKHSFLLSNMGFTTYCRHSPSCSKYFARQVKKEGLFKGGLKGLIRILSCF